MKKKRKTAAVEVALSEREFRRLQDLAFRARRTGGGKLAASVILRALIRFMERLDVDLRGVKTGAQLARSLRRAKLKRDR